MTDLHQQLPDLVTALTSEPLWHASLGSKELFHSNLIAWMVERDPDTSRAVNLFRPWLVSTDRESPVRVLREFRHLDLVIELPGYEPLVIENKTFSQPSEAQLERYAVEVLPKLPGHPQPILFSLTDPGWTDGTFSTGSYTWRWMSYRELGERLRDAFTASDTFAEEMLAHEATLMTILADLNDQLAITSEHEPTTLASDVRQLLAGTALQDAIGKSRTHQLGQFIRARLLGAGITDNRWPLEVGFTNGQPLLSLFWKKDNDITVGWQYQGGQWRLAMMFGNEALYGKGRHEQRATEARQYEDYFNFAPFGQALGVDEQTCLPRRGRIDPNGFNRYDPDFVYRYRVVPPSTTVAQFLDLVTAYSELVRRWQPTQQ